MYENIKLTFIKIRRQGLPIYYFKHFQDREKAKKWWDKHRKNYFIVAIEIDGIEVVEL